MSNIAQLTKLEADQALLNATEQRKVVLDALKKTKGRTDKHTQDAYRHLNGLNAIIQHISYGLRHGTFA